MAKAIGARGGASKANSVRVGIQMKMLKSPAAKAKMSAALKKRNKVK